MNNTVSNMQALQQFFQIAVATLDNNFGGEIDLTNGDLTFSLAARRGLVNEISITNGTRTRTWMFRWMGNGKTNSHLRTWMFDTLLLWDSLDKGSMPGVALTDQDLDTLSDDILDAIENQIVGHFDENEAAFHMFQARLNARMEQEWNDRNWNAGDGLLPTGEHRDSM